MNKDPTLRWYIEHGICVGCRKENAMPGRQKCPECLYKQTLQNMKYRSLDYERTRYEKRKAQREERIAAGLCPICGKPATHGQLCIDHYIRKQRMHQAEKDERRGRGDPRRNRMENGLCCFCDSSAMDGKKVCEKHYQMLMSRPGFAGRKGGDQHPWAIDESRRIAKIKSAKPL